MFSVNDGNYKGRLLEIAATHFDLERPEYFHFEYGPPHAKVFLCICSFFSQTTLSEGRTKIAAEQSSSQLMLKNLEDGMFTRQQENWIRKKTPFTQLAPDLLALAKSLPTDPRCTVLSLYGDSVLRSQIALYLFIHYSGFQEGILTRIISETLRDETRAEISRQLQLDECVSTIPTTRTLAEALSAFIGKLAFTASEEKTQKLILGCYKSFIDLAAVRILKSQLLEDDQSPASFIQTKLHNFKTELFEYAQTKTLSSPTYRVITQTGADHDPTFTVSCTFQQWVAEGSGKTVKAAEQEASCHILTLLRNQDVAKYRMIRESAFFQTGNAQLKRFKAPSLHELKKTIHWPHFDTLERLEEAFTHSSKNPIVNYQRLEFLGDALLKKILLKSILQRYPELTDKALLSMKTDQLVSAQTQAKIAKKLDLGKYLFTGVQPSESMLSDILEALIAVVYLDAEKQEIQPGVRKKDSEAVIIHWFSPELEAIFGKSLRQGTKSPYEGALFKPASVGRHINSQKRKHEDYGAYEHKP